MKKILLITMIAAVLFCILSAGCISSVETTTPEEETVVAVTEPAETSQPTLSQTTATIQPDATQTAIPTHPDGTASAGSSLSFNEMFGGEFGHKTTEIILTEIVY